MCLVVIPAAPAVQPRQNFNIDDTPSSFGENYQNFGNGIDFSFPMYPDLEGDVPRGNARANDGTNGVAYADPGPVPEGPGYERLIAVLENAVAADWAERGSPANPNIRAAYAVSNGPTRDCDNCGPSFYWCAAFVSWALLEAGLESKRNMGSSAYRTYGSEIDWRNVENVRRGDVIVFQAYDRPHGGHVGFVWGYNPGSDRPWQVLGGNQGNDVKLSNYKTDGRYTKRDGSIGGLRVCNIKRAWSIPDQFNTPLTALAGGGQNDSTL